MILTIDIGGTKTLLGLYECDSNTQQWQLNKYKKYRSVEQHSITAILVDFADNSFYQQVNVICAGVAGPINNDVCNITNLAWNISIAEIRRATGVKLISLLNDLEATAWGINALSSDQLLQINESAFPKPGHTAILSAGTGLGEAMIIRSNNHTSVVASEGGHTDFAPKNKEQDDLLYFLRKKYPDHVSYERLVSGHGLYNIYQFLKQTSRFVENKKLAHRLQLEPPAEVIGTVGIAKQDILCEETLRIFCQIYAAEAANLALKCLPYSGIVLAGGITSKILPNVNLTVFLEAFIAKGRYASLLKNIPIYICNNEDIVLLGALDYAQQMLSVQ